MRDLAKRIDSAVVTPKIAQKLWAGTVASPDGCWLWCGNTRGGYGVIEIGNRPYRVHRISYFLAYGEITDLSLVVDHLCGVRRCVRPEHLRLVTNRENIMAENSNFPGAINSRKAHCHRGHILNGDNLRVTVGAKKQRYCAECKRLTARHRWNIKHNRLRENDDATTDRNTDSTDVGVRGL